MSGFSDRSFPPAALFGDTRKLLSGMHDCRRGRKAMT